MTRQALESKIAIIGPGRSWETVEAVDALIGKLRGKAEDAEPIVEAIVLDGHRGGDPRLLELERYNLRANRIGGLAIVNQSYEYDDELDLSVDPQIQRAADKAARALLPIFINVEPTLEGLDLEDLRSRSAEVAVFGNDPEIIRNRLEVVEAGVA
jgi:hypothetical protein